MTYISLAFSAIFVSNVLLAQFYGLCPFLGVSKKKSTALSMGGAVLFVITISSIITYFIYVDLLVPNGLEIYSTIIFILVIAASVQFLEMVIKRFSPVIYTALGAYLPLITTNCAVLGVAIDTTHNTSKIGIEGLGLMGVIVYSVSISIGYAMIIYLFSAIREEIDAYPVPSSFKGLGVALLTAFVMAMAFIGFGGMA
jgi:electron transport complex protein RnfA